MNEPYTDSVSESSDQPFTQAEGCLIYSQSGDNFLFTSPQPTYVITREGQISPPTPPSMRIHESQCVKIPNQRRLTVLKKNA